MKDSGNKPNPNKVMFRKTKRMPRNLKEKAKSFKESLNRWEETATFKKKNSTKSENNSKIKEEKAPPLRPPSLTFKSKTKDLTIKSKTWLMKSMRLITQLKPWLTSSEKPMKSLTRSVVKIMAWEEIWQLPKAEFKKEPTMKAEPTFIKTLQRLIEVRWTDLRTKWEA